MVEKLCQLASETTPVRAVVLRVGQMVGSTADGKWNEVSRPFLLRSLRCAHLLPIHRPKQSASSSNPQTSSTPFPSCKRCVEISFFASPDLSLTIFSSKTPSWLPVDYAASTIYDLVLSTPPTPRTSQCWHGPSHSLPFFAFLVLTQTSEQSFSRTSYRSPTSSTR